MTTKAILRLLATAALACGCGDNTRQRTVCVLGECPDAATADVQDALVYPLMPCDGTPPVLPACTCGDWACLLADGGVGSRNICGPLQGCFPDAGPSDAVVHD